MQTEQTVDNNIGIYLSAPLTLFYVDKKKTHHQQTTDSKQKQSVTHEHVLSHSIANKIGCSDN